MINYPVHIPLTHPDAARIEDYLNSQAKGNEYVTLTYFEIGIAIRLDKTIVQQILRPIDGGSNGITIYNSSVKPRTQ